MDTEKDYASVDQAAEDLGISRATMWGWIRRYEVKTFRIIGERKTFVRRADIAKLREPMPIDQAKKVAA